MKRFFYTALTLLVIIGCLTSCNFTSKTSGALSGEVKATPAVEKMVAALSEGNVSDAAALMHPEVSEGANNGIEQMSEYLCEHEAEAIELVSNNKNTSTGTSGKTVEENLTYQLTFTDGTVTYLSVVYLTDKEGEGFSSFQLVLGVV